MAGLAERRRATPGARGSAACCRSASCAPTPYVQHPALPLFTAGPALAGMPARTLDVAPLYAGRSVERLHDVRGAAEVVAALTRAPGAAG